MSTSADTDFRRGVFRRVRFALACRTGPLNQVYTQTFLDARVFSLAGFNAPFVSPPWKQAADLLGLLFVVQTISPAVQFLRELAQHVFSIPPGPWNDGRIDVLDSALYLAFRFTGIVPKGLGNGPFLAPGVELRSLFFDTVQADPSESRNCASEPSPVPWAAWEKLLPGRPWRHERLLDRPRKIPTRPFRRISLRCGCKARTVLPVANSLQPGDWDLRDNPSVSR
jgi:hypothetical protein